MQGLGVFGFGVSASTAEGPIARGFKTLRGRARGRIREFPTIRGTLFWGPYSKDPTI